MTSAGPGAGAAGPRLAPRDDIAQLAEKFAKDGRVLVPDLLPAETANALYQRLHSWTGWHLVSCIGGQHRAFEASAMEALDKAKFAQFVETAGLQARQGFQYLFRNYPLYDLGMQDRLDDPVLRQALGIVRSPDFLELARAITGRRAISYTDSQATAFGPGHYLTTHDDDVDGKNRLAAYVVNLTPGWRADFGGQLQFLNAEGHVDEAFVPGFNTLALFSVPAQHAVSVVAPFAPGYRYALTGWLRQGTEVPPGA
ncbi:2OG-Fe(II) oxygenase [Glycocaulis sp.]|uniref:2OG-Fe(II) oxygenase n=1 Tax=Glycocaulis sp. TaxID=1969725 RepID=UPI003D25A659